MSPALKRSHTAKQPHVKQWHNNRTARWETPPNGSSVLEIQVTEDPSAFKDVPAADNYLTPPYHWHWYQTEYFQIVRGRFVFNYEGKVSTYDASSGKITIPPHARHNFWPDPTCTEACEVHISTQDEHATGLDEKFFRNLYSYLEDCATQKLAPSLPQLLLFLDSAETSLALPGPGILSRWLSWSMGVVVGRWFGGYVLGLKDSYPEYYEDKKTT